MSNFTCFFLSFAVFSSCSLWSSSTRTILFLFPFELLISGFTFDDRQFSIALENKINYYEVTAMIFIATFIHLETFYIGVNAILCYWSQRQGLL